MKFVLFLIFFSETHLILKLKPCTHGSDLHIRKFCMYANFAYVSKSVFCFAFTWLFKISRICQKLKYNSIGSFRPRVVLVLSRFGPGSFRPGSIRPGSIRPGVVSAQFGGSFRPIFLNYQACYRRSTKYILASLRVHGSW